MSIKINYETTNRALLSREKNHLNAFARRRRKLFIIKQKNCGSVKKVSEDIEEFTSFCVKGTEINPIKSCDIPSLSRNKIRKLRRSNKRSKKIFLSRVEILFLSWRRKKIQPSQISILRDRGVSK